MKNMGGKPRYVNLGGISLFYWEFEGNSSQTIIFLHGLLDEGFSNRRIIKELLGENYRILVFDLPGYGKSKLPMVKFLYQIDVWASLLREAFDNLLLKSIILVGHSMGGLLAQHIVLKDKESVVSKLILLAPGGMPHPKRQEMQELLFPKSENDVTTLLHHLYGVDVPDPNFLMRKTLVSVWNGIENTYLQENTIKREDEIFHGKKVKLIKIPTLILAGTRDEITPPAMMKEMKTYIKGSRLVWINDAKHAIHLERAKEIAKEIILFCKNKR